MLKHHLTILAIFLLLLAPSATRAQNYGKMSGYLRSLVMTHNASQTKAKSTSTTAAKSTSTTAAKSTASTSQNNADNILALVKGEEAAVSRYCVRHQGDIHICHIPLDNVAKLSEDPRIKRIELNKLKRHILNDLAAEKTTTTLLHQGIAPLPKAFDGTGVVAGIQDISFDYNHPTFRSKKDGRLRIVRAWDELHDYQNLTYNEGSKFPIGKLFTTEADIVAKDHSADADINYHGTHTTGTMAGSGYDTPYSGMAPEADIYMVNYILENNMDLLTDEQKEIIKKYGETIDILGFQNIFDYADSIGKPCVINFSIGGTCDTMQETVLYNEYLQNMVGPGKIIVASVGNEGIKKRHLVKSTDETIAGGLIVPSSAKDNEDVAFHITTKGTLTLTLKDLYNTSERNSRTFTLGFDPKKEYADSAVVNNLIWNAIYECKTQSSLGKGTIVEIASSKDIYRDQQVVYDVCITPGEENFENHSYLLTIEGENTEAEIWIDNAQILSSNNGGISLKGAEDGGTLLMPGSFDCIIGVGASAWKQQWKSINGSTYTDSRGKNGERANFSSVGPSFTNVMKPDVIAPGTNVISSFSSAYYPKTSTYFQRYIAAKSDYEGKDYYWSACCGTSMSTPVVSGIVALWLQADPTLTPEKVREVIQKTSHQHDCGLPYPNDYYGYGEIDAYRGLLEILQLTGINELSANQLTDRQATVRPTPDGNIVVTLSEAGNAVNNTTDNAVNNAAVRNGSIAPTAVSLYTAGGQCVGKTTLPPHSTEVTIPAQHLHGIIAVQVGKLGSTLVRLP